MAQFNLHARIELVLVLTLLLGSCDGKFSDVQIDQVSDIASGAAETVVDDSDKIKGLEDRVSEIEDRLNM